MSDGVGNPLVCSKETLSKLLNLTLSSDLRLRTAAEEKLKALKVMDKFGIHLTEIAVNPDSQLNIRQLAVAYLKEYARTYLYFMDERLDLCMNILKWETKLKIMNLLLLGLQDSNNKIRNAVAHIISTIVRSDGLRSWRGTLRVFDTLLGYLRSASRYAIDGALQVLINCQTINCSQSVILQEMYRILEGENQYSMGIRSQTVKVFRQIMNTCETDFFQECLQLVIPTFCKKFIQILSDHNDFSRDSCDLKTNIVEAINLLTTKSPKYISDTHPQMLPLVWKTLIDSAKVYQPDAVDRSRDNGNEETDSDGQIINNFDDLVKAILYLVWVLMDTPSALSQDDLVDYHWFYLQDTLSPEFLHHLILYMNITDKQIELWTNDPDLFLVHEKQLGCPDDLRDWSKKAISDSIVSFPTRAAANSLVVVILKQLEISSMVRVNRNSNVSQYCWKSHEAFLSAFCLAKYIIIAKQNEGTLHFGIVSFLKNVVLADLNNSESHPLLIGRCLCLGGLYAEEMPLEMASCFFKATIYGLQNQLVCTKICAAIAAKCWFCVAAVGKNYGFREKLKSHLPDLFQGLFNLGRQSTSKNVLELIMEILYLMALFHKVFTASVSSQILTLTIAAYRTANYGSQSLTACKLFFKKFTLNPKYIGPLQKILVPTLVGGSHTDVTDILVRYSPQPLSNLLIGTLFPAVCKNILSTKSQKLHCSIEGKGKVICTYLSVAAQQVIGYKDEQGKTGLQYILQVAAEVFRNAFSESEVLVVCEIVILLIKKADNIRRVDASGMEQLLVAVLSKMKTTLKQSILRQSLLIIWAQLINTQIDPVINLLTGIPGGTVQMSRVTGEDILGFVIFQGFCEEYTFFESNERKTVTRAFCKILVYGMMHQRSWLHYIVIKEAKEGETTTIPLLVRICNLITTEFSREVEELNEEQEIE